MTEPQPPGSRALPPHIAAGQTDSAGTPWQGRDLKSNPFSGDTGEADAGLLRALQAAAAAPLDPQRHRDVLTAFAQVRIYAPVVPAAVEHSVDERGLVHDNKSEMAMVRLAAEDGRECTPAFTDIPTLTAWADAARPVPIESERLCVAAIEEDSQLVVIDPGSPHAFLLRRTALWSFVQGHDWYPAWADQRVAKAAAAAAAGSDFITAIGVQPGSGSVHISGPEIRLVLRVSRRPQQHELAAFQQRLSAHEEFVSLVDSLAITLTDAEPS